MSRIFWISLAATFLTAFFAALAQLDANATSEAIQLGEYEVPKSMLPVGALLIGVFLFWLTANRLRMLSYVLCSSHLPTTMVDEIFRLNPPVLNVFDEDNLERWSPFNGVGVLLINWAVYFGNAIALTLFAAVQRGATAAEFDQWELGLYLLGVTGVLGYGYSTVFPPLRDILSQLHDTDFHIGWLRKVVALPVGSDLISRDLHTLTTFVNFPYHAMALAWILGALALLLAIDRAIDDGRRPVGLLVALIVLSLVTTLARPYELPMIALAWFLYALYRRGPRWRLGAAFVHGAALLPVVVYQYWISKQPVWAEFARESLETGDLYPYQFLVGFAFFWPLAFIGIWRLRRDAAPPQARLLVAWFVLMLVPMLFGGLGMAKLAGGAPLLFAALAAPAVVWLWGRGRRMRLALAAAALLSLPSTVLVFLYWRAEAVRTVDGEVLALVNALPAETRILTDCETGRFIPALTGRQVWCGHWALTPHYKDKDRQATLLGLYVDDHVVPGDDGQVPPLHPVNLKELTVRDGVDVLLAPVDAPVWLSIRGPVTQVGERWRLTRLR